MSEREEFSAHLVDESGEDLQAAITVTSFKPPGDEIVEKVRDLLVDEFRVVDR